MQYSYEIKKLSPKQEFMTVVYRADGYPDYIQNYNPRQFDEEHLTTLITGGATRVIEFWERWAEHPEEVTVTTQGSGEYTPPPPSDPIDPNHEVISLPIPEHDPYTHIAIQQPILDPMQETVGWDIVELTDEQKAQRIELGIVGERMERDRLLRETDHWMMADTPEPTQAQLDYRQALRDVPSQAGYPQSIVWPTKPE